MVRHDFHLKFQLNVFHFCRLRYSRVDIRFLLVVWLPKREAAPIGSSELERGVAAAAASKKTKKKEGTTRRKRRRRWWPDSERERERARPALL